MIAPKLRLLLNTKKDLQAILKVPNGVPFNQYVRYLAWVGEPIPKAHLFGDYVKGRFTTGGKAVLQDEVGEFTRLSKATNFVGGELVEYEVGEARVEAGKGLLIEPQITNDMSSGDFKNNYPESLAQVTTGVDSGLGFNYTRFIGGGGEQRATVAFGMQAVSLFPVAFGGVRGISFLVKAEYPVRYMRISTYSTGMSITHSFNTTIDLSDGSIVREHPYFKIPNVDPMGGGWLRVDLLVSPNTPAAYRELSVTFGMDGEVGTNPSTWTTLPEGVEVGLALPQHVTPPVYSSLINSYGTPATRSPDLLRIPLLPNQSITIDADEGLRCVKDGASALISADTPAYLRTFAVDEAKVAFNNYATGVYKVDDMEVSFEQLNEFTRLTAATNFVGGELVEYAVGQPRIEAGKGLLIEPQATNFILHSTDISNSYWTKRALSVSGRTLTQDTSQSTHIAYSPTRSVPQYNHTRTQSLSVHPLGAKYIGLNFISTSSAAGFVVDVSTLEFVFVPGSTAENLRNVSISSSGGVLSMSYTIDDIGGWNTQGNSMVAVQFYKSLSIATASRDFVGDGVTSMEVLYIGANEGDVQSSGVITTTSPATRSPDVLRLTIPAGKTLTLDADDGISYVMENATTALITATKPAYIRSARIA